MTAGRGTASRSLWTGVPSASTTSALPSITSRSARRTGTMVSGSNEALRARQRMRYANTEQQVAASDAFTVYCRSKNAPRCIAHRGAAARKALGPVKPRAATEQVRIRYLRVPKKSQRTHSLWLTRNPFQRLDPWSTSSRLHQQQCDKAQCSSHDSPKVRFPLAVESGGKTHPGDRSHRDPPVVGQKIRRVAFRRRAQTLRRRRQQLLNTSRTRGVTMQR